jgi:hypothetical protein
MNEAGTELASAGSARDFRRGVLAASILLAPLLLVPGTIFNPAIGGIGAGAANIAANAAANTTGNQIHLTTYVLGAVYEKYAPLIQRTTSSRPSEG